MKLIQGSTLSSAAEIIGAKVIGDPNLTITGINEIHVVEPGDLVFVDHPKYYQQTLSSPANVIIIDKDTACPPGKGLLVHPSPFDAFNQLALHFLRENEGRLNAEPYVHQSAQVMPGAYIGKYASVGAGTVVHPGAVIYDHCIIGENVVIHANAVIGSDGFYYKRKKSSHEKLQSVGRVIIESGVEIGAGCTLDRGVTGDTIIGTGSKFDNQVHIGHDVRIGKRCLLAAQVGIAGCVTIGDGVIMWGQSGCAANVTIGDGAVIYAQSGIMKSIEGGQSYFGSPAGEARKKMREIVTLSELSHRP